jgi:hypothetical protein
LRYSLGFQEEDHIAGRARQVGHAQHPSGGTSAEAAGCTPACRLVAPAGWGIKAGPSVAWRCCVEPPSVGSSHGAFARHLWRV